MVNQNPTCGCIRTCECDGRMMPTTLHVNWKIFIIPEGEDPYECESLAGETTMTYSIAEPVPDWYGQANIELCGEDCGYYCVGVNLRCHIGCPPECGTCLGFGIISFWDGEDFDCDCSEMPGGVSIPVDFITPLVNQCECNPVHIVFEGFADALIGTISSACCPTPGGAYDIIIRFEVTE